MIRVFDTHQKDIYSYYSYDGNVSLDTDFRTMFKEQNSRTAIIECKYPQIIHTKKIGLSEYGVIMKNKGGYRLIEGISRASHESVRIMRSIIDSLLIADNVIELTVKQTDNLVTVNSESVDSINLYAGASYKLSGDYVEILYENVCVFNSNSGDLFRHREGNLVMVIGSRIIPLYIFAWKDPLLYVVDGMREKYNIVKAMDHMSIINEDIIIIPPIYGTIVRDKKFQYTSKIELNFDHPSLLDQSIIIRSRYVKGFGRVTAYMTRVDVFEDIVCDEAPWTRCTYIRTMNIKTDSQSISMWIKSQSIKLGSNYINGYNKWRCIIISNDEIYVDTVFMGQIDTKLITISDAFIMNIFYYDTTLTRDNVLFISGNIGSKLFIYEYCVAIYTKGPTIAEDHAQVDHYISSFHSLPYNGPFTTIVSIKS